MNSSFQPPECVIVTGPRGAGKTRWIRQEIEALLAVDPVARCAVVAAEQGRTRLEAFVRQHPQVAARHLWLPCLCCPGLANLATEVRTVLEGRATRHLFIEFPLLAAAGLIDEFDRALGWPRRVVLCRDQAWLAAEQAGQLSWFQQDFVPRADLVVTPDDSPSPG